MEEEEAMEIEMVTVVDMVNVIKQMAGGGNNNNGGGGGDGGKQNKSDELKPHAVMEQLPGIQYCVNSPPPWVEATFLGFQHFILSLGMTVLIPSLVVPQMGGGNVEKAIVIQTSLFVMGWNTLLHSFFGTRLSTVIGSSYTYVVPVMAIVQASRYQRIVDPHQRFAQTMRGIQGAMISGSLFQMVFGFIGLWRNAVRQVSYSSIRGPFCHSYWAWSLLSWFSHDGEVFPGWASTVNCNGVLHTGALTLESSPFAENNLVTLLVQYMPHIICHGRAVYDRFAILITVPCLWLYAFVLTSTGVYNHKPMDVQLSCRTDQGGIIGASSWIMFPYPFQWGHPTFNGGEVLAMAAASLVSLVESTGTFLAAARYGSATPVPSSVLGRGAGWLGIGTLLNGMFGTVSGSAAAVENAGLLALTKVGSRSVIQMSAAFMIFFSILGKLGAVFASIPLPLLAAVYCVLFAYVSSAGVNYIQFCNMNSFRTKFILGFSLFMGISVPQYIREHIQCSRFNHFLMHPIWFNNILVVIFASPPTVAVIVGLIMDCTLCRKEETTKTDSGLIWWEKFRLYNSDLRNDEFYALPCRLNKLFPSF
ncbi:Nucleobase cation symporter 2 family [Dillenia turbinata]|uniref:Nucleobase cation symporter 2 family n=1 Tax=Dillenia turbinata TaxID=194707 RepID=A0AAN8ZG40_9MAGN